MRTVGREEQDDVLAGVKGVGEDVALLNRGSSPEVVIPASENVTRIVALNHEKAGLAVLAEFDVTDGLRTEASLVTEVVVVALTGVGVAATTTDGVRAAGADRRTAAVVSLTGAAASELGGGASGSSRTSAGTDGHVLLLEAVVVARSRAEGQSTVVVVARGLMGQSL